MADVIRIPINRHLGMAYDHATGMLMLPETDASRNHFGQVSFCAQFTLAESASAQWMFDRLGMDIEQDIPTLRNATTKFHKPTRGSSVCHPVSFEHDRNAFQDALANKGKIVTSVGVEVVSEEGVKALSAVFRWLVVRRAPST